VATIREQMKAGGDAPPGSSWLVRLIWALIDLDLPALEELDVDIADIIGNAPDAPWEADGHTISWHLGYLVSIGDPTAIAICDVLSEFLGKDHCINAFEHGS
jgi:hypothetical protein